MRLVLAHDFGRLRDYATDVAGATQDHRSLQIGVAQRCPLGTSYHSQAQMIYERLAKLRQQHPDAEIGLCLDATGVGQAAAEIIERSGALKFCNAYFAVTFTGGDKIVPGRRSCDLSVPKSMLVKNAQAALGAGLLALPPDAAHLRQELRGFIFKPGKSKRGRLRAEAKDEKTHDDLVAALLLCVFGLQVVDWAGAMRRA